jgi:superfamily II DNA or RNA helicase
MYVINKFGEFVVPKYSIPAEKYIDVRSDIYNTTIKVPWNNPNNKFKNNKQILCFREDKKNFYIPREFGIRYFKPKKIILKIGKYKKFNKKYNTTITLRNIQVDVINELIDIYNECKVLGGILKANTGFGKTILCIYLANILRIKTLIVVKYVSLAEQWQNEINKVLLIPIKNIPILSNIPKSKIDTATNIIRECDFAIIVSKSLSHSKKFKRSDFKYFGFVILDEIHSLITNKTFKMFRKISRRFTLGVTATPIRLDNYHELYLDYIGPILCEKIINVVIHKRNPKVFFYNINYINISKPKIYTFEKTKGVDYTTTYKCMAKCINRKNKILSIIKNNAILNKKIKKILIICKYRDEIDWLYEQIKKVNGSVCKLYSMSKSSDRKQMTINIQKSKIIIGIYNLSKQGLNINNCNCLILLHSPIIHKNMHDEWHYSELEQLVGRVFRDKNELSPNIWLFNDNFSFFKKHTLLKKKFIKKIKGWKLKTINLNI